MHAVRVAVACSAVSRPFRLRSADTDSPVSSGLSKQRGAGIQTTDHLVGQALLNPVLMRVLLSKATPQTQVSLMTALGNQLRRVSLVSAVQTPISRDQQQQQRQAAVPAFVVRHNDLVPQTPRAASYAGPQANTLLR